MPTQAAGCCWKRRPEQSLLLGPPTSHRSRGAQGPTWGEGCTGTLCSELTRVRDTPQEPGVRVTAPQRRPRPLSCSPRGEGAMARSRVHPTGTCY